MKRTFLSFGLTLCVFAGSVLVGHAQSSPKSKPGSASSASASGDDAVNFGISVEPALPLGDFKEVSSFGFGFNGLIRVRLADKLAFKGSIGYMTFISKTITYTDDDGNGNLTTIQIKPNAVHGVPFRGGIAYDLTDNLFVQGSIGVSFINNGVGSAFLYTPGLGYRSGPIEALLKYESWSKSGGSLNFLGLHVGYYF